MIVTFSGVSGCGKSTIGNALKERLEKEGYKVKYRIEFDYFLLKYVLKCIHFLDKEAGPKIINNILIKKKYSKIISKTWAYLVFLDFLLEYFYLNIFFRKHIIIMDRCIIDLWVGWDWMRFSDKFIEGLYLKLFPKYDIMNVFIVDPKIALCRGKDKRNDIYFYKTINDKYVFLSKLLNLKVYNSASPKENILEEIYQDNLAEFIKLKPKR